MQFLKKYFVYIFTALCWACVTLACIHSSAWLLGLVPAYGFMFLMARAANLVIIPALLLSFAASGQIKGVEATLPIQYEKTECDTFHGVAMVIDTLTTWTPAEMIQTGPMEYTVQGERMVQTLISKLIPAYTVGCYVRGSNQPWVKSIGYYREADAAEIPTETLLLFKH